MTIARFLTGSAPITALMTDSEWDARIWRLKLFEAPSRTEQKHECACAPVDLQTGVNWSDSILEGNP